MKYDQPDQIRSIAHRVVTEGVNLKYVDQMRRALYDAADALDDAERRLKTAEDALDDEKFLAELMTAQRDEAFKHLTTEQQHECIRAACLTVQPLAVDHFSAALAAIRPNPEQPELRWCRETAAHDSHEWSESGRDFTCVGQEP